MFVLYRCCFFIIILDSQFSALKTRHFGFYGKQVIISLSEAVPAGFLAALLRLLATPGGDAVNWYNLAVSCGRCGGGFYLRVGM